MGLDAGGRLLAGREIAMSISLTAADSPQDDTEAHAALVELAARRTLHIPADLLARHVLALPGAWDWPVRRAAMEAIVRRIASVRVQEISVPRAPQRGPWGRYLLGRADAAGALPYD